MKLKPDETLDQWVRQSINQLPDTPPPGSSFDSERLWLQLRPVIQVMPSRRPALLIGWLAAACLTGLVVGWFWLHQSVNHYPTNVAHRNDPRKTAAPVVARPLPKSIDKLVVSKSSSPEAKRPPVGKPVRSRQPQKQATDSALPLAASTDVVAQTTAVPEITEFPTLVEKSPERSKPNVAATAPRRRFRIVHENELRAEEEARPKLYYTDHFVRLGTGQPTEAVPDNRQPVLLMPLTTRTTH